MIVLKNVLDMHDFIDNYVKIVIKHPLYLKLGNIMSIIIEVNVSDHILIDFKKFLMETKQKFDQFIQPWISEIAPQHKDALFTLFHVLSTSLYANYYATTNQQVIYKEIGYPYQFEMFSLVLSNHLKTFMIGLKIDQK
jgi:hypothetical protein